jgi:DcuC family C4-dicarboxylate transporter
VLGEATTGSTIFDIFAYIYQYLASNLGSSALPVILVFAYVEILNHLHATDMMAYLISIPIRKIRSVYISVAVVVLVGSLLRIPTGGGPALIALMIALFYPMLLGLGCTRETAAAAMLIYGCGAIGPADPSCIVAAQVMGIDVNPALWFTVVQIPYMLYTVPILILLFILISKRGDSISGSSSDASEQSTLVRPDCPVYYAVLPLLPLVFMIVFSPLLISGISINIGTACILSLIVTLIVILISSGGRGSLLQENLRIFFSSIGTNITGIGLIMMFGMLFATCMSRVGGLDRIGALIMSANLPGLVTVLILCVFTGIIALMMGSFYGALSIGLSMAASFVSVSGMEASVFCYLVLISVFAGTCCSPANPGPALVSAKTDVPVTTIIRRCAAPIWITMVVGVIITGLVF